MMFNIHKHISHLIFVLVHECGENEICNQKIILRSISRQRFWFLVLFSVLFVNCGDNIKVYFSIVTHEIPLRVRKKNTLDSMHNQVGVMA
jgi:hypothetical protein